MSKFDNKDAKQNSQKKETKKKELSFTRDEKGIKKFIAGYKTVLKKAQNTSDTRGLMKSNLNSLSFLYFGVNAKTIQRQCMELGLADEGNLVIEGYSTLVEADIVSGKDVDIKQSREVFRDLGYIKSDSIMEIIVVPLAKPTNEELDKVLIVNE